ncbi:MAG: hypothetical protein AAFQ63_07855 [Cyanobacteria bacterium J06621_11]
MAKPAFLRYLPARLKPLGNPAVWIPLTVIALLGAILWEYQQDPDWFNRQPVSNLNPESSLTPEEEARLSEIDTLDVLLNGARVPEDTKAVTSQINPDAPVVLTDEDAEDSISSADAIAKSSLEDYPIPGSPSLTTTPSSTRSSQTSAFPNATSLPGRSSASNSATNSLGSGNTNFNFGNGLVNPAAPSTNSALAEAVNRREAQIAAEQAESGGGAEQANSTDASRSANPLATPVVPTQPVPGSFIRTTPEMSPPAGTTGYRVPDASSLPNYNVVPTRPTRNPFDATSSGANSGAGRQSVVPAPANVAPPAIGAPGTVTNSGVVNSVPLYTAPSSVQPAQDPIINPRP